MFSSLTIRNFRIYWIGMLVSLIGTWVQQVAQSWLVFQLTNSAFLLGLVGFLSSIPMFLFSLIGGVVADRVNKRNILLVTQTSFMLLAFILAVLTQAKLVTPFQIMVIAFLNGLVMAFDAPSRQAVVVELVGKTHLTNAIALNAIAFNSSRIVGPALAGIFVAAIGMSGCFYLNGFSFLAVIGALFVIKLHHVKDEQRGSPIKDLREGLHYVLNNRLVLTFITMVGAVSMFGLAYIILMPIFANDVLGVGVRGLAVLMSSSGIGALCGALLLARLGDFRYKGKLLITSSLIYSLALTLFAVSKVYTLSIVALAFVGGSSVTSIALINTLLQANVPDRFRGRVMSAFMLTFAGIMPFGNLLAGALSQAIGVSLTLMINGIILAVFFVLVIILCPQVREVK